MIHQSLLSEWQRDFVDEFTSSTSPRNTLIAGPGQGKTVACVYAAAAKLQSGNTKKIALLSDYRLTANQWAANAKSSSSSSIVVDQNSPATFSALSNSVALTFESLEQQAIYESLMDHASAGGLLLIIEGAHHNKHQAFEVTEKILELNSSNQMLLISDTPGIYPESWKHFGQTYNFGKEFIFEPKTLILPSTQILLAEHSPSLTILSSLQRKIQTLDELGWREFEILISELLASDGYEIELMRGTKDGGVDVVAVKDLGETGMFKALWQAKKNRTSRKVGISTIRELADVRNEHQANKGIIVTTSFLTRDALKRVERDRYLLGKVDSDDLKAWVERKLHG